MLPTPSDRFASESGRHRRPETLADTTRWRPTPPSPAAASVAPDLPAGHPADEIIRRARREAGRADYAASRPQRPETPESRPERRPADRPRRRRAPSGRGRHARPAERPPVTGSHRAPGTLPIESWLLIGKARQQALLAGLVAVGLALVTIPVATQQRTVDPISAAGSSVVTTAPSAPAPAVKAPAGRSESTTRPAAEAPAEPASKPPTSAPATPTEQPISVVPAGDGPHQSLKTTGSQVVALTFDDGPDPVQTPKILALLDKYQIKATFCVVGIQVERHPDIVRQIAAAGHALCNHTYDHSLVIGKAKPEAIAADLARTNAAIRAAAPDVPIPFFRAPGGNFTDRLVQVAYRDGMTSLYWDVDPRDWDHKPAKGSDEAEDEDDAGHTKRIAAELRQGIKPGSIVLSHDFNQPETVTAYEELLPYLTENFELGVPAAPSDN